MGSACHASRAVPAERTADTRSAMCVPQAKRECREWKSGLGVGIVWELEE